MNEKFTKQRKEKLEQTVVNFNLQINQPKVMAMINSIIYNNKNSDMEMPN